MLQAYYPQQYDKHLKEQHYSELHKCKCCAFVTLVEADLTSHYTVGIDVYVTSKYIYGYTLRFVTREKFICGHNPML